MGSGAKNLSLEQRIERLELITYEAALPGEAIVGAAYVARLFDCSEEAVVRGRFGTDRIPRCREKPVGFRKMDVHRVLKTLSRPLAEQAADEIRRAGLIRRKPVIRRSSQG
jgi:hypothetical protein